MFARGGPVNTMGTNSSPAFRSASVPSPGLGLQLYHQPIPAESACMSASVVFAKCV